MAVSKRSDYRLVLTDFDWSMVDIAGLPLTSPPETFAKFVVGEEERDRLSHKAVYFIYHENRQNPPQKAFSRRTVLNALERLVQQPSGDCLKHFAAVIPQSTKTTVITQERIEAVKQVLQTDSSMKWREDSFGAMYNVMAYMRYGGSNVQRHLVNCFMWLKHFDFVVAPAKNHGYYDFDNICSIIYVKDEQTIAAREGKAIVRPVTEWDPLLFDHQIENTFVEKHNSMPKAYHCKWLKYWLDRLDKLDRNEKKVGARQEPWDWMAGELNAPAHEAFPYVLADKATTTTDVGFFEAAAKIASFAPGSRPPTMEESMQAMKKAFNEEYLKEQINMELALDEAEEQTKEQTEA
eukprot:Platyproteum_vivax@DN15837_c0_g1_i1.p1